MTFMNKNDLDLKTIIKGLFPIIIAAIFITVMVVWGDESGIPLITNADRMEKAEGHEQDGMISISSEDDYSGVILSSRDFLLNPGIYNVTLYYSTNGKGSSLAIMDNGVPIAAYELVPGYEIIDCPFTLTQSSERLKYVIAFGGEGSLTVEKAELSCQGRFYNDSYYITALIWIIAGILCAFVVLGRRTLRSSKACVAAVILGIGLFASLPYLTGGLGWAIDLCYHLSRIEGIKDGLISGSFPVAIYPKALYGNGYLGVMYPDLFLYPAALLRMAGVSMADSFKSLIICGNILCALFTYLSIKELGTKEEPDGGKRSSISDPVALTGALLYTVSPYRFTNIYARGAVGEFLAMTFMPLIVAGMWHIVKGCRRRWPILMAGMCGLLYSHLLSAAFGAVFCGIISLVFIRDLFKKDSFKRDGGLRIVYLLKAGAGSLLLSVGFLVPFMTYMKNGKLWVGALATGGAYSDVLLRLSGIFSMTFSDDYHVLTLGLPLGICLFVSVLYLFFEGSGHDDKANVCDDEDGVHGDEAGDDILNSNRYLMSVLVFGIIVLFMSTEYFPSRSLSTAFPVVESILSMIQFAWRLLGPAALIAAICGSVSMGRSKVLKSYVPALMVCLSIITILGATRFRDEDFASKTERIYSPGHEEKLIGIPRGANTIVYPFEWRPEGTSDGGLSVSCISSDAGTELTLYYKTGTTSTLVYNAVEEGAFVDIPVIYYPGYKAVGENGAVYDLTYGTNNMIRIPLICDGNEHTVTVSFGMPGVCYIAVWISIITAVLMIMWLFAGERIRRIIVKKEGSNEN